MTEVVILLASSKFDLRKKLDNDMFNHVVYVANRVLMLAKTDGISRDTLVDMGKYLWRLFNVVQAYSHKNRDVTLARIVDIVIDFKGVFAGGK